MKSLYPNFYEAFLCKADGCENTCCQKWEIDIDEATAEYYDRLRGPMGKLVQGAMYRDEEGAHFRLKENGECALLEKGLCQLIKVAGEESLCTVCSMHPRFFKYFGDWEFCGLGLSCEATVELLAEEEELLFMEEEGEEYFSLADIVPALGLQSEEKHFTYAPRLDEKYYKKLLEEYACTEPVDEKWEREILVWKNSSEELLKEGKLYLKSYQWEKEKNFFQRVYTYIMYRQLDFLEGMEWRTLVTYAQRATDFIFIMTAHYGEVLKQVARWSEQIEYNEDNVIMLLRSAEFR